MAARASNPGDSRRTVRGVTGSADAEAGFIAITTGAVVGGYIVDTYGASGPLTLTAILAAATALLVLLQPRG